MRAIALLIAALASCMCDVPESTVRHVLASNGMQLVSTSSVGVLTPCGRSDMYARRFVARGADGKIVRGAVCCTPADSCSIRIAL